MMYTFGPIGPGGSFFPFGPAWPCDTHTVWQQQDMC